MGSDLTELFVELCFTVESGESAIAYCARLVK